MDRKKSKRTQGKGKRWGDGWEVSLLVKKGKRAAKGGGGGIVSRAQRRKRPRREEATEKRRTNQPENKVRVTVGCRQTHPGGNLLRTGERKEQRGQPRQRRPRAGGRGN